MIKHAKMRNFITLCFFSFFFVELYAQQSIEIKGVVTDTNHEPLIGVNITVSDIPGFGTITAANGSYKIKMQPYHKLVFTYVGFEKREILVKDQRVVNIIMKESETNALDEVVVTATGTQKKVTVTGAVTNVSVGELRFNPTSSIANSLAGNVSGVLAMQTSGQPGKNVSEFWIRGISTFGANSSAYVLVDGFERDLNDINIEDIQSFSVLKDASATAIYGSKGANGVVLITTKHGTAGKINIDVKAEASYNTRTRTPEFVDGYTYASLLNEACITRGKEPKYQPEELEILRLGLDQDLYPNVNWRDKILKDGAMNYRANLTLSGGGTTARYFASASYISEGGMYKTDKSLSRDYNTNADYHRWNYRLNTDIDITKSTIFKLGVSGSLSKRNSPGNEDNLWASLFGYTPILTPIMYSNGYIPAVGSGDYQINPWISATQTGYNENWENNIQTNVTIEQNFDFLLKGLRFIGRFGYDTNNESSIKRRKKPELWRAERVRNSAGDIIFTKVSDSKEMAQSSTSDGDRREFLDFMLNYDRTIKQHHFGAVAKYTQDSYIKTQDIGDDVKNGISKRNQGLAGQIKYNFDYRYFVDFNFGYTGSENFSVGHQFGFFPAYSFAWNVGGEKFIKKHLKWVEMLKLRYSHGRVGNDNLGNDRFPYLSSIIDTGGGYEWAEFGNSKSYSGMMYSQVASPYVTWEIATKNDIGLDLSLFKDNFSLTIDYFDEKREGIYMSRNYLSQIVGLESTPKANVGAVRSKGFDGNFKCSQNIGKTLFTFRGNITYSKSEILNKDEENNIYSYQMERGYRVSQTKGLIALGLFKDYDDIRNSPSQTFGNYQPGDIKYKDVNGDGIIDSGDIVAIGATDKPNLIYGMGMTIQYKGIDANILFQGAGKSTVCIGRKNVRMFTQGEWGNIIKGLTDNRWISADISGDPKTENPDAPYPRLSFMDGGGNNDQNSSFWLRNFSYVRLKTLDVGYSFPKSLINKFHFNKVRLFVTGTNLITWSSFKLWDPELLKYSGDVYPLAKTITLGLSVNL